MIRRTTTAGMS